MVARPWSGVPAPAGAALVFEAPAAMVPTPENRAPPSRFATHSPRNDESTRRPKRTGTFESGIGGQRVLTSRRGAARTTHGAAGPRAGYATELSSPFRFPSRAGGDTGRRVPDGRSPPRSGPHPRRPGRKAPPVTWQCPRRGLPYAGTHARPAVVNSCHGRRTASDRWA